MTPATVERDCRHLVRRPGPLSGRLSIDLLVVLAAIRAAVGTALRTGGHNAVDAVAVPAAAAAVAVAVARQQRGLAGAARK
jgi:hypothetical protein